MSVPIEMFLDQFLVIVWYIGSFFQNLSFDAETFKVVQYSEQEILHCLFLTFLWWCQL